MLSLSSVVAIAFSVGGVALSAGAGIVPERTAAFDLPSGVHVVIVEAPFAPRHSIGCFIGSAAPKTYVKRITATYHGRSWLLDSSCMFDAWGERPLQIEGVIRYFGGKCDDDGSCAFRGLFSDGAESFVAEWYISDGIAKRTVFSGSVDLKSLFMKNIDPPTYDE